MADNTRLDKRKYMFLKAELEFFVDPKVRIEFTDLIKMIDELPSKQKLSPKALARIGTKYQRAFEAVDGEMKTVAEEISKLRTIKNRYETLRRYQDKPESLNKLSQDEQESIKQEFNEMPKMARRLISYDYYKRRFRYMSKLRKTLSKDIKMIEYAVKEEKAPTLKELYETSRSSKIKFNLANANTVGAGVSVRYNIPGKGFFTPSMSNMSYEDKYRVFKRNIKKKYDLWSGVLSKKLTESLVESLFYKVDGVNVFFNNIYEKDEELLATIITKEDGIKFKDTLIKLVKDNPRLKDAEKNEYEKYFNECIIDAESAKMYVEYLCGSFKLGNANRIERSLGINSLSKTDKRNAAFYNVAEMFGCQDVVAKASGLHIKDIVTGEVIKGTYMEKVNGADINSIYNTEHAAFLSDLTPKKIDNLSLKKSLAKLQVMDYLNGNPDRHGGNMLYQYDDEYNMIGVIGIDNDSCLGSKNHVKELSGIALENLSVIPKETFDFIVGADRETLRITYFGHDISDEEVNAALDRLEKIKTKVLNDMEFFKDKPFGYIEDGRIKVVTDEELEYISIYELGTHKNPDAKVKQGNRRKNLFGTAIGMAKGDLYKYCKDTIEINAYKDANKITESWETLSDIAVNMRVVDRDTFNGSKRFENVMDSIDRLIDYMRDNSGPFFKVGQYGGIAPEAKLEDIQRLYEDVSEKLDTYIGGKNVEKIERKDPNSNAFKRLKLAKDAKKMVVNGIKAIEAIYDKPNMQMCVTPSRGYAKRVKDELDEIKADITKKHEDMEKEYNNAHGIVVPNDKSIGNSNNSKSASAISMSK